MKRFAGKTVTVMGLGLHGGGLATTQWLLKHGAHVIATDLKTRRQLATSIVQLAEKEKKNITFVLGEHRDCDFRDVDMVVQNPGVPRESRFLAIAQKAGVPIENEATLFFKACKTKNIIGITGTRGKSTTSAMVDAILKARPLPLLGGGEEGVRVWLVGNIRTTPMLKVVDRIKPNDWVITELSSWHLEVMDAHGIAPHIAVVTNVLRDHLNRYGSMRSYARAKEGIVRNQTARDIAVLNKENAWTRAMAKRTNARVVWFAPGGPTSGFALRVPGAHNVTNAVVAMTVARTLKIPMQTIRSGLAAFRGLPGRLETIRTLRGVTYINDTTATTPDGTIAALRAFAGQASGDRPQATEKQRRIVLICGGTDKALVFHALIPVMKQTCKAIVFLPGTATEKIKKSLQDSGSRRQGSDDRMQVIDILSMREAVKKASVIAKKGDIVLLSPGAASFGLFVHEFDRGDQFEKAVRALD